MDLFSYQLGKKAGGGGGDLDWSAIGYNNVPQSVEDGYNYALEIKENWDTNIKSMKNRYYSDKKLLMFPLINTENVTNMENCFNSSGIREVPLINTSNVTNIVGCFSSCWYLQSIAALDFQSANDGSDVFYNCQRLETLPLFNTSNIKKFTRMFQSCSSLKNVPVLNTMNATTFQNTFQNCSSLTNESLNNIMKMCINAENVTTNKTLQYMGLTSAQATTCQSLSNYDDFVAAGWTTGY